MDGDWCKSDGAWDGLQDTHGLEWAFDGLFCNMVFHLFRTVERREMSETDGAILGDTRVEILILKSYPRS